MEITGLQLGIIFLLKLSSFFLTEVVLDAHKIGFEKRVLRNYIAIILRAYA